MTEYLTCLWCGGQLQNKRRRVCSNLCQDNIRKANRKMRRAGERAAAQQSPVYLLTDGECKAMELVMLRDGLGGVMPRKADIDNESFHTPTRGRKRPDPDKTWNNKAADLDVSAIRLGDRQRFGGIVYTDDMHREFEKIRRLVAEGTSDFIRTFYRREFMPNAVTCGYVTAHLYVAALFIRWLIAIVESALSAGLSHGRRFESL